MDTFEMLEPQRVASDTIALRSYVPVPGFGMVPVNAYVIRGAEPVLIDTGMGRTSDAFTKALWGIIEPRELRWIWLTHADPDHVGSLQRVMQEAPAARLVTTYLGLGKLNMMAPVPLERVVLVNPSHSLDVGDRQLLGFRPPSFDAPETVGLFDSKSGAMFCADFFGALLGEHHETAEDIPGPSLREGMVRWATVDAPWLHAVDSRMFAQALSSVEQLEPEVILSSHLPVAGGEMLETLLTHVSSAPLAVPFVGPDQEEWQQALQQ